MNQIKKKKTVKPLERVNTRIREDQKKFIKDIAKKQNLTEGEVFRIILDFYIYQNKNKK